MIKKKNSLFLSRTNNKRIKELFHWNKNSFFLFPGEVFIIVPSV